MNATTSKHVVQLSDSLSDPVTSETRQTFEFINCVILCGIISFFGIGANITNIYVFVKQGFKDSVNISLLGLAVSDLACSSAMFWLSVTFSPWFHNLNLPINIQDLSYASSAMPHICFNRITSFITTFITLERCLCIAMPLKVKIIITPLRAKVINFSIFIFTMLLFCPFYFVNTLVWRYSPSRNKTILAMVFTENREIVDSITFFMHSVLLSSASLLTVIICTIILVVKLNKKTKWRSETTQAVLKQDTVTIKDKKVVKMITLIATIFIVCYIPPTVNFLIMTYNTDFTVGGRFENILYVIWSFAFVLEAFNSSVNIFVYLKMSSKFKNTCSELVCGLVT